MQRETQLPQTRGEFEGWTGTVGLVRGELYFTTPDPHLVLP
jgi:hypothetical protein